MRTLAAMVDWNDFLSVADRHRVNGLVWDAIQSLAVPIPEPVRLTLSDRANLVTAQNLRAAVESASLSKALADASIPHLFVKGLAVGALAYATPFLKQSWDIDVLVSPDRISQSGELLQRLGYELIIPKTTAARLARWHEAQKDSAWRHPATGIIVELHSRLADNRRLIPAVGLDSPQQTVAIAREVALPTLAKEQMFAHLCVHGASSAWFRLKWISDMAALLFRWHGETERLFRASQSLGAGRSAGQALLLAHRLFDTEVDPQLLRELQSERSTLWLADVALDQLLSGEPGDRMFGTAMIHISQLSLLPGLAFKADEAKRQVVAALYNLFD